MELSCSIYFRELKGTFYWRQIGLGFGNDTQQYFLWLSARSNTAWLNRNDIPIGQGNWHSLCGGVWFIVDTKRIMVSVVNDQFQLLRPPPDGSYGSGYFRSRPIDDNVAPFCSANRDRLFVKDKGTFTSRAGQGND
jgi:hypothetical protein